MEIDVIDLKLKSLKFTIKKDERRTSRARSIYNNELVKITEVDKLEEDKYIVKAVVEGNYDNYTTMLKINNGIVAESKCTC